MKRIKSNKKAVIRTSIMEMSSTDLNEMEAIAVMGGMQFDKQD